MTRPLVPITQLITIFSEALRALRPHVVKAGVLWEDGENYDDWDDVATALYRGIVANSIACAVEGDGYFGLSPYALKMLTYEKHSILFARDSVRVRFSCASSLKATLSRSTQPHSSSQTSTARLQVVV